MNLQEHTAHTFASSQTGGAYSDLRDRIAVAGVHPEAPFPKVNYVTTDGRLVRTRYGIDDARDLLHSHIRLCIEDRIAQLQRAGFRVRW